MGIFSVATEEFVVPCEYENIDLDGRFAKKNGKWAILNGNQQFVTDHIFTDHSSFHEGFAWVKKDTQVMLVDTFGRIVRTLPYPDIIKFEQHDVFGAVRLNNKFGYIDRLGNIIIPAEYDNVKSRLSKYSLGSVSTTIFPVSKNGKWGYVNAKNEIVLPLQFGYVGQITDGIGYVAKKDLLEDKDSIIGIVNSEGRLMFNDGRYERVGNARAGKLWYKQKGRLGYLDSTTLQVVIPAQYDLCNIFYQGAAVIRNNGLAAVIDTAGRIIIPFKYIQIIPTEKFYIVSDRDKWGTVDLSGKIITPPQYDYISMSVGYSVSQKNSLRGILDTDGKVIIPASYSDIEPIGKTMYYARKGDNYFFVYRDGTEKAL
jgi:hypothetical protein